MVEQLHWGGGTPTFLARDEMATLMGLLRGGFDVAADAEISIEVDPRKVDAETIAFLGSLGFNRISVGIQDFDPEVQKAVNRIQSEEETRTVIDAARANGFVSVNADLIYGLPKQTVAGFSATLDKVIDASPDRIALYSYAHVPHLFKPQRRIAQRDRKLHRNFQGYSTKPDCDLLAFGISAIGKVGAAYVQNVRTLDEYYDRLDAQALPVMRGVLLNADDLIRRDVIQKLMCDFDLDFAASGARHGIVFAEYFAPEIAALRPLAQDGLVELTDRAIVVTPRGRLLVRTVAMQFDRYLREARERAQYSRVI
jgi:oxygen-independent coproporphyrinogen-3 oxidase